MYSWLTWSVMYVNLSTEHFIS